MEVTNHAIERMFERGITFDDVNRVAENGNKKEIRNNEKEDIIYKVTLDSVVLIMTDKGHIITTYKDNHKKKKKEKKRWEEHYSHSKKTIAYKKRKFELRRKDYEDELV